MERPTPRLDIPAAHPRNSRLTRISATHVTIQVACLGVASAAMVTAVQSGSRTSELRGVIGAQRDQINNLIELAASTRNVMDGISQTLARADEDHRATVATATAASAGSVYMVGAIGADGTGWQQIGTAWVAANARHRTSATGELCGPSDCDVLATNAHVVDAIKQAAADGLSVVARMPGIRPIDLPVLAAKAHPGWKWASSLAESPLLQVRADGDISQRTLVPAADVGLVYVEAGTAASALNLASIEMVTGLQAGMPVGIVGYPSESMAGPRENHVAQAITGQITALTSPFHQPVDAAAVTLVHHNLPMGGGSSGSPILDRFGRVIAVQSAGNVAQGAKGRVPIGTGYAQRVDLVAEMLDGTAEEHQNGRQVAWARELRRVAPTADTLLGAVQKTILSRMTAKAGLDREDSSAEPGHSAVFAVEQQYTVAATEEMNGTDGSMRSTERMIAVKKGDVYAFLAVGGPLSADVDVSVFRGKKVLTGDTAPDPLPVVLWTADEDGLVRLVVSERRIGAVGDDADDLTVRVLRVGGS